MFNPCFEHCYVKYGKQYSEECEYKCEYAKSAKELEELKNNAIIFPQTIKNITFYNKKDFHEWVLGQEAEIERLRKLEAGATRRIENARTEAIEEFQEKLKESTSTQDTDNINEPYVSILYYADDTIDYIAKELKNN